MSTASQEALDRAMETQFGEIDFPALEKEVDGERRQIALAVFYDVHWDYNSAAWAIRYAMRYAKGVSELPQPSLSEIKSFLLWLFEDQTEADLWLEYAIDDAEAEAVAEWKSNPELVEPDDIDNELER